MDWINELEKEHKLKLVTKQFFEEKSDVIYKKIYEIASDEADRINDEFPDDKLVCYVKNEGSTSMLIVVAELSESSSKMTVHFQTGDFIKITRSLIKGKNDSKILPEVMAVRYNRDDYKITFEPEFYDGENETSEIGKETLAKMLVEPVVRDVLGLPQKSYKEGFGK